MLTSSGIAWAQPTPTATAKELNEQARRSYNLGHWQDAIDAFEKAYQLSGDPALLFNLAQSQRHLGDTEASLRFYRAYLREKTDPTNREIAEQQIKELEAQAAHSAATGPPAGTPTTPSTAPPSAPPAAVTPPAPPPADTAPTTTVPAALAGNATPVFTASVPPPRPTTALAVPRWLVWTGGVATVALGVSAIVVGTSATTHFNDLRSSCGQTAAGCAPDQISSVKTRDRAATILWALAGVTAAATGVMIYVDTREATFSTLWSF